MKAGFWIVGITSTLIYTGCTPNLPQDVELAYQELPELIDFNYDVKPILSDKCFACHGPDKQKQKANLRLDVPEGAFRELESIERYAAIVPYERWQSEAIRRILSKDLDTKMPPPESHLSLTAREIAIITKWVDQGAEYQQHWSLITPVRPNPPQVSHTEWIQNPIDNFILTKLEQKEIPASEKAKKETLLRRLRFDLTGLPPTIDEIEAFVADNSTEAYERLVDRLLASSAYGERMAMDWMDVARYADTDGYLDDKHRDFSPWRDWVINAFNSNMPYDEFTTWQLAGDLIPEASKESILATAFNRLHKKNSEAGIIFEEFRSEYVADRTLTLGKAFLGLTLECARCHDHKYDPISQEDYYKIYGFFNSTNELGTAVYGPDQVPGPALLLTTEEQQKIIAFVEGDIEKQDSLLAQIPKQTEGNFKLWSTKKDKVIEKLERDRNQGLIAYYPFDEFRKNKKGTYLTPNLAAPSQSARIKEPMISEGYKNNALFLNDFTKVNLAEKNGWFEHTQPFTISLSVFADTLYEDVGIFYHCEELRLGLKGYSLFLDNNHLKFILSHSWPQNTIEVICTEPIPRKEWTQITITYDGSGQARGVKIHVNGEVAPVKIQYDNLYKGILFKPDLHTYGFEGFMFGERDKFKIFKNGGIDELKIYDRQLTSLEVLQHYNPEAAKKVITNPNLSKNKTILRDHYLARQNVKYITNKKHQQSNRVKLNKLLDSIPEIMVMGDLPVPRPTYILERGAYDAPSRQVQPGVPEAVLPYDSMLPANRLGLTKWLFDKDNPLTARVYVNRIWKMHFGRGIVKSIDDFGNQGALPTHPDLLDWLAVDFRESGWDIKRLHKLIVMSATYQQNSKLSPKLIALDPDNELLARGPSFRLPAEMIRDNALAISGLLVDQIGGRSVYPYQPEGLWDEITNKVWRYKYLQQPGEGLYRRSLYSIWKRASPPPSMMIFDAPDRGVCIVDRNKTSTPLQALVLLNDPQYLEAARVLAANIINENGGNSSIQLVNAFTLITGRKPDNEEIAIIEDFYNEEVQRFTGNKQDIIDYLSIGQMKVSSTKDASKIAALATVINGIMNTTEAFTLK